jgi:hypothetical protein
MPPSQAPPSESPSSEMPPSEAPPSKSPPSEMAPFSESDREILIEELNIYEPELPANPEYDCPSRSDSVFCVKGQKQMSYQVESRIMYCCETQ